MMEKVACEQYFNSKKCCAVATNAKGLIKNRIIENIHLSLMLVIIITFKYTLAQLVWLCFSLQSKSHLVVKFTMADEQTLF